MTLELDWATWAFLIVIVLLIAIAFLLNDHDRPPRTGGGSVAP